jgi:hypothetical protein
MSQLDYLFCLNLLLSVNDEKLCQWCTSDLYILMSLLSFDMSDCTLAAMDEINNNNNNH